MTAPDLVEVAAGVLAEHQQQHKYAGDGYQTPREHWIDCSCGITVWTWQQFYDETPDSPDGVFAAHQARAVLDALTEAGTVEWGVRWGDGTHVWTRKSLPSSRNQIEAGGGVLVSRLTFPWTAVE